MLWLGLILGVVVGVISGVVGIGGGVMIVPALVYMFKIDQHRAQGTSLAALLLPIGFFAFWQYYKAGNADLKLGLVIALGFAAGGYFGGLWAQSVSDLHLRRIFAALLIAVGVKMLLQR